MAKKFFFDDRAKVTVTFYTGYYFVIDDEDGGRVIAYFINHKDADDFVKKCK